MEIVRLLWLQQESSTPYLSKSVYAADVTGNNETYMLAFFYVPGMVLMFSTARDEGNAL